MSVTGIVKNGVIVLPPGTNLPEGVEVKVETLSATPLVQTATLAETATRLARKRSHLPDDYALNHGHYIRGEAMK